MKISEYNQMLAYLTRREPTNKQSKGAFDKFVKQKAENEKRINAKRKEYGLKPNEREETMPERVDRVLYEHGDLDKKPKHFDNKNIKTFEEMQTKREAIIAKPKIASPVIIDISGIKVDPMFETLMEEPIKPDLKTPDKLEGIETILGIKSK
jgi:hypothetical protein